MHQTVCVHACVSAVRFILSVYMSFDIIVSVSYMFVYTCMAECHACVLSACSLENSNSTHIALVRTQPRPQMHKAIGAGFTWHCGSSLLYSLGWKMSVSKDSLKANLLQQLLVVL